MKSAMPSIVTSYQIASIYSFAMEKSKHQNVYGAKVMRLQIASVAAQRATICRRTVKHLIFFAVFVVLGDTLAMQGKWL